MRLGYSWGYGGLMVKVGITVGIRICVGVTVRVKVIIGVWVRVGHLIVTITTREWRTRTIRPGVCYL